MSRRFGLFCAGTLLMGALVLNRSVVRLDDLIRK